MQYVFENTTQKLSSLRKGAVQLEYSSHIVKVGVEAIHLHYNHWCILKETTKPVGPFATMSQEPWHCGKGAKLDHVIKPICRKVRTHTSYKNFNNQGIKMILLSDNLWSITNNSKSFANGNKSTIRNNLGLCKHFEI